jgi:cyanophycin synthetase
MPDYESRRLTGASFFCDEPAAIIDADIPLERQEEVIRTWQSTVELLHRNLQRSIPKIGYRTHEKGQSLYFTAPIDALYSAIELGELALQVALDEVSSDSIAEHEKTLSKLFDEEARPDLLLLQQEALAHDVPFLWDDDFVSLGYGKASRTWGVDELPEIETLDWNAFKKIPLAIITGTNGKSTTTRLCNQILKVTGHTVGFSSTDGIWAGEKCLDHGDYSGPGGAREVLRNQDIDAAILEVARGGLLRRGLGVAQADVALITNVAEDHLGEYGVNTLKELVEAKFIVRKAVSGAGTLLLNADDPGVVSFADSLVQKIVWYSLDQNNAVIRSQIEAGNPAFFVKDGHICISENGTTTELCSIKEIPITIGGAAKHNVANALAASALCRLLGVSVDCIRDGLTSFDGNRDNPGRGNLRQIGGVSVMVDFAHNPHGLNAVVDTLLQLPAKRRLVMLGHAGDRSDEDIQQLTRVAHRLNPDIVVIFELEEYLRGRSHGEIPGIITRTLKDLSFPNESILQATDPVDGTNQALAWAEEGDFLLLLALGERGKVIEVLDKFEASK